MKNLTKIFTAVVAGMLAFSCVTDTTEDLGVNVGGEGLTTITVSLEESRTQLGDRDAEGKYPLYWSTGDQIAINGVASVALAESYDGASSATFQFETSGLSTPYCVVYPVAEGTGEGTLYPVNFLAEQPYTVGTFASGAAPMYGYVAEAGEEAIQLNHLTGVLRLAVKGNGEAITSITVKSELGKIAGPFTVDCTSGALTAQEGASNTVTVTFEEALVLGADAQPIYIAVPSGSYGTFFVTLRTASDKMTVKFDSNTKPIAVGMVREFTEFTYGPNDVEEGGTIFEIDSKDALIEFATLVSGGTFAPYTSAQVVADINMSDYDWTPIEGFNGCAFDGGKTNGYAIDGLTAPLFGETSSTIMNVDLTNVNIASNGRLVLGAVACVLSSDGTNTGSLTNCHVSGTITVSNPDTTIASDANKYSTVNLAGVVGTSNGDITNCVNEANITISQIASSDNAVVVHPSVGGIVGYSLAGAITNCVNGNEAKTTGAIKYHDNHASQLYVPHIGGIAGLGVNTNTSALSSNTNYGAIDFDANAAGDGGLDYGSTTIGGIVGTSVHDIEKNNNYGTIDVSGGNIKAFFLGGVVGNCTPVKLYDCHNHQGANITVDSDVAIWSLNVAGVVGSFSRNSAQTNYLDSCTNDAPLHVKASTDSNATANSAWYYRVGGIVTYANNTVQNCENKANGDITIEGNITLLRANSQPGFAVVGVSCYHTTDGTTTNLINRGDINIYANITPYSTWNTTTTHHTYGKIDIAGISGYNTRSKRDLQNYGNITIGNTTSDISISGNGIHIGGLVSYASGTVTKLNSTGNINAGSITINRATLNGKFSPTIDDTANAWATCIGGIDGYRTGSTSYSTNSGAINITSNATISTEAYIGGCTGYRTGSLSTCSNTGAVTVGGKVDGGIAYIGGIIGYTTDAISSSDNNGAITISGTTSTNLYAGGITGYTEGALTTVSNGVNGSVTTSGTFGSTICVSGCVGAAYSGSTTLTGVTNAATVTIGGTISAGNTYIGGTIGYMNGTSLANSSNTGNVTYNASANGILNIGGCLAWTQTASTTLDTCFNKGVVSILNGSYVKSHTRIGGLLGYANATLTLKDCYNDMPANAEFGVINSRVNPTGHIRVGGLIGMTNKALTIHANSTKVYNNAGVCYDGQQNTTSGLSIGGLVGLLNSGGISTINGKVYNSGHIYYAGVCFKSTLLIGGCFGTMGEVVPTMGEGAELFNIGDITALQNATNNAFPTASNKTGSIGGISGAGTGELDGAKCYYKLKVIGDVGSYTTYGMVRGATNTDTITNCQIGGTICTEQQDGKDVDVPLTNDNFFLYIHGGENASSAADANGCTWLSAAPSVE